MEVVRVKLCIGTFSNFYCSYRTPFKMLNEMFCIEFVLYNDCFFFLLLLQQGKAQLNILNCIDISRCDK